MCCCCCNCCCCICCGCICCCWSCCCCCCCCCNCCIPLWSWTTSLDPSLAWPRSGGTPECHTLAYPCLLPCQLVDRSLPHPYPTGRAWAHPGPAVARRHQRQRR